MIGIAALKKLISKLFKANGEPLRVLIVSNAPWSPTGYGTSTNELVWRLVAAGLDVYVFCFFGLEGAMLKSGGVTFLPRGADRFGNDMVLAYCEYFKIDIVITNMDVWVLDKETYRKLPWVPHFPVDHDPLPPAVEHVLGAALDPISYSQNGQQVLRNAGIRARYIPIPVNTNVFKPIDRAEARMRMGFKPGSFIIEINSANKGGFSRKAFFQQIGAVKVIYDRHKETVLYLHTDMTGAYGEDLNQLLRLSGLPKEAIATPSPFKYSTGMLSQDYLNDSYNSADVLSNASMAEGWGIATIEAQAAGCPVIVTDGSAMTETCGAGWLVEPCTKIYTPQGSFQVIPGLDSIVDCYEKAYQARGDMTLRRKAREFAMPFDSDTVVETWIETLYEIATNLGHEMVLQPAQAALPAPQVSTQPPPGLSRRQRRKWRQENGVVGVSV